MHLVIFRLLIALKVGSSKCRLSLYRNDCHVYFQGFPPQKNIMATNGYEYYYPQICAFVYKYILHLIKYFKYE